MIYIETGSEDACYNFAVEDFVIRERDWGDTVLLFWRTSPTLMVGSFQNIYAEVNLPYARAHNISIVRRKSGGGTIYTDENGWQFSYFFPNQTGAQADFASSAREVVAVLNAMGVPARFNGRNDIIADGRKISGNARHVSARGVLHHGSLLFDTDVEAMVRAVTPSGDKVTSKGIKSVRQRVANIAEFLPQKLTSLQFKEKFLSLLLKPGDSTYLLKPEERLRIEETARAYRDWEWTYANGPKFELSRRRRFEGGTVECCLNVREGKIAEIELRGDFFADGSPDAILSPLAGCRYERESLRQALSALPVEEILFRITRENLLDALID